MVVSSFSFLQATLCDNTEQRVQAESAIEPSVTLPTTQPAVTVQSAVKKSTGSEPMKQPVDDRYKQQCVSLPDIESWADHCKSDEETSSTYDLTKMKMEETKEKKLCKCTWCCRSRAEEETKRVTTATRRGPRGASIWGRRMDMSTSHSTYTPASQRGRGSRRMGA